MFKKTLNIISVSRDKITAARVKGKKVLKTSEYGWTKETIELTFSKIKSDFNFTRCRLLFMDEISYLVKIPLPASLKKENEREYIANALFSNK
jgi:hypothetical protein